MTYADGAWDPDRVRASLSLLSRRWVVPVLVALDAGPLRRTALRRRLDGVSDKILTDTLRRMESSGLISRSTIASVPVEVDYAQTEHARALWPIFSLLHEWSAGTPGLDRNEDDDDYGVSNKDRS